MSRRGYLDRRSVAEKCANALSLLFLIVVGIGLTAGYLFGDKL